MSKVVLIHCIMIISLAGFISCNSTNAVQEPLELSFILSHVSTNGGADGAIDLNVSGGTPPYQYLWSNGETTEDLTNLGAGSYSVTVTDSDLQTKSDSVIINQPSEILELTLIPTHVTTFGVSDGAIDLSVSGGTSPYQYLWSNGETTEDIYNLSAGEYSVIVTDSDQQTESDSITINQPLGELSLVLSTTNTSIFGASDGIIHLTVTGGLPPYQYLWSNGETTADIYNLSAGEYSVVVTDSQSRTKSHSAVVYQPPALLPNRTCQFHVPVSYSGDNAVPLVIALHQYGSDGRSFKNLTHFNLVADNAGFIVVYPNATGSPSEWNVGIGFTYSVLEVDDIEFISNLIDAFKENYNIDDNRVYVTGFSNGSIMAHKLAAELSSKITAIGAVAAQATSPIINSLNPDRPVAIIHIHMLDDSSVSYYGCTLNGVILPPVEDVIAAWVSINNCGSRSNTIYDNNGIIAQEWTSNDSYADIVLYKFPNGGHSWLRNPISVTELIWEFFESHSR